jgi:hypothetical protein
MFICFAYRYKLAKHIKLAEVYEFMLFIFGGDQLSQFNENSYAMHVIGTCEKVLCCLATATVSHIYT